MGRVNKLRKAWREMEVTPLASAASTLLMNNAVNKEPTTKRTDTIRRMGAHELALTLMNEDMIVRGDKQKAAVGEFLARAVANARRQGVVVPNLPLEHQPIEVHTGTHHGYCKPDEIDFPLPPEATLFDMPSDD